MSAGIGQADEDIQIVMSDPLGNQLLTVDDTTGLDRVSVVAETSGSHNIIFFNPLPLQAVSVKVDWEVNP